jgi:hypothetical protein
LVVTAMRPISPLPTGTARLNPKPSEPVDEHAQRASAML